MSLYAVYVCVCVCVCVCVQDVCMHCVCACDYVWYVAYSHDMPNEVIIQPFIEYIV